jgi:N-sulfoglucosamine sulfohydrolase
MNKSLIISILMLYPLWAFCQAKPNILFIVSEDNGPELGCYGSPVRTPHLDNLAKQGILFKNAYVSQAGCSQSRASFLTGLYPHQNGQIGLSTWEYRMHNPDTPNIPKSLKEAGYTTGIIGKLHVNPESAFPFDFMAINSSNFSRKDMNRYAEEAEKFMSASDKPFFLQINYPDAHTPFIRQVDGLPQVPLNADDVDALPYMLINNDKLKVATANYYNCIMRLDAYIGELLNILINIGKNENTLIVYIGDHGADILRGKRTSYEGGIKIPMIISWQNKTLKNIQLPELVSTIDLYPTFLEVAGLAIPQHLPGKSLMPLLKGEKPIWREYLFTEYHVHSNHNPYPQRTVRNAQYKLIWNPLSGTENPGYEFTLNHIVKIDEEELLSSATSEIKYAYFSMKNPPEYELYDLEKDPFEIKNLSHKEEYAEVLKKLKNELLKWQKYTSDPLIEKSKARKLFDMIQEKGIAEQKRTIVPYLELLDPKLKLNE